MLRRKLLKLTTVAVLATTVQAFPAVAADKIVRIGVTDDYSAQWKAIKKILAKEGIQIKLVKYSDYATPNRALNDGDIDLNAFQHKAFLANDIKRNDYKLVAIGDTIVTPIRLYNNKEKIKSLSDIKDGDVIGILGDLTNGGRALKLLEAGGLIEVDPTKGVIPTKSDITKYNKKIKIREMESGFLARLLPDLAGAVINGGNALTAGLDGQRDSILSEDINPETNPNVGRLVNVIVARQSDKDNPIYKRIVEVYQTPEIAKVILDNYKGAYLPAWKGAENYKIK